MYELLVTGMICQGCIKSITNALKTIDAVANVEVDLANSLVKIETK
jgi:copper chaperone CopZ